MNETKEWLIREKMCERTEDGAVIQCGGYDEPHKMWYSPCKKGELFQTLQQEYGRCISKMYYERKDGTTQSIGWVFEKESHYSDTGESFIQETWVELHEAKPTVTYHYVDLEETSQKSA